MFRVSIGVSNNNSISKSVPKLPLNHFLINVPLITRFMHANVPFFLVLSSVGVAVKIPYR